MQEINNYIPFEQNPINNLFVIEDRYSLWNQIKSKYEYFGFKDNLSDVTMIDEYNYIIKQYYKYIFRHQKEIESFIENPEAGMKYIEDLLSSYSNKAPNERKELVYSNMRDEFLTVCYSNFLLIAKEMKGNE